MPGRQSKGAACAAAALVAFACPNDDCADFNRFGAGNLSVCERIGKDKRTRRLYCRTCGHRFSERQGTLLEYAKLPEETIVRIVKCLVHGCSIEATADICEVTRGGYRRQRECVVNRVRARAVCLNADVMVPQVIVCAVEERVEFDRQTAGGRPI